ncbi:uncharacterized protein LOC106640410 [Copidosoma floridanum]|uniref:uncharacterized protein LOC106640410 n=1 Tax=Copidosoma floridanum TaxID=29053 RepID=UPI0006C9E48C|nr:uncharacterized protein LOC106640410 [Copidosoma floridanum]
MKFNCQCQACLCNWPSLQEMYEMPVKNTDLFCRNYFVPRDIELFHKLTPLVRPILCCHKGTRVSQRTVAQLSEAMRSAVKLDDETVPSVIMGELMICLSKVLDNIYNIMD